MSTMADVAAHAGVSKATASRALSGRGHVSPDTRERVARAAQNLRYVAHSSAASLATGRTFAVAAIMPPVDRWFFAQLLAGIQGPLIDNGYDLTLHSAADGTPERVRMLAHVASRHRFDGIIAVGLSPRSDEFDRLEQLGRPLVHVGFRDEGNGVAIDDVEAARIATEHLLALGHTDIVFLGGAAADDRLSPGDRHRIDGFQRAMNSAGLGESARRIAAPTTMPGGYNAAVSLLGDRSRRPHAIVGVCDEVAIGAIIAARRLGIAIPTHLSIVGIDNHAHADMFSLTTVQQNPHAQGRDAALMLLNHMQHSDAPPQRILLDSTLVVRSSTTVRDG